MTRREWEALVAARDTLGLAERATLKEIKQAYRRLSKRHHPDVAGPGTPGEAMIRVAEAYQLLLRYCAGYSFPLAPGEHERFEAEDWWMDRFGEDPLWSRREKT